MSGAIGRRCTALVCVLMAVASSALASGSIESKPLHFAKGATSTTVLASLQGGQTVDYKVTAKAGQTMTVALATNHLANYFNVLPPGSQDVAIFVGSTSGNDWTGSLPADGEYTVRVYLMRSAARRNETADYKLTIAITGSGTHHPAAEVASVGDAKVGGTPYHATGKLPCSMGDAPQGAAQCDFGVIRGNSGDAQVHVTPPGGFERVLVFSDGEVSSDDATSVKVSKNSDTWLIVVNDYEHYQIPEAVISGG